MILKNLKSLILFGIEVLKGLGYKDKDIKGVIPKVNKELKIEDQIKDALRLLVR